MGNFEDNENKDINNNSNKIVDKKTKQKLKPILLKNGDKYKGNFVNGKMEGKGKYYWKNGDIYEGMFKAGKFSGNGKIKYKNGKIFKGKFYKGKKEGFGELFTKDKFEKPTYQYWDKGKLRKEDKDIDIVSNYINTKNNIGSEEIINSPSAKNIGEINESQTLKKNHKRYKSTSDLSLFINVKKMRDGDILGWTQEDVKQYFININFPKIIPWLEEEKINGKKLINMNYEQIEQKFQVEKEVNLIMFHIDFLKTLTNDQNSGLKESTNLFELSRIYKEDYSNNNENKKEKEKEKILDSYHSEENNKDLKYQLTSVKKKKITILNQRTNKFCSLIKDNRLNYFIKFKDIIKGESIGKGAFGEVYKGEWLGIQVAVKKLIFKNNKEDELYKFLNEINILASMRHPNIVLYLGASVDSENCYMITEYIKDESLGKFLHTKKNKLTDKQKISIALQISTAIHYMHYRNIVHRDLKSDNVLLSENHYYKKDSPFEVKYSSKDNIKYKVKLADFGLSTHLKNLSGVNITAGTYPWMAPEVMEKGLYTKKSDIFSYGMIIWELITGQKPYSNFTNKNDIYNEVIINKNIVKVPKDGNEILKILAQECLNYNANDRPSIEKIVDYLYKANKFYQTMDTTTEELYEFIA